MPKLGYLLIASVHKQATSDSSDEAWLHRLVRFAWVHFSVVSGQTLVGPKRGIRPTIDFSVLVFKLFNVK